MCCFSFGGGKKVAKCNKSEEVGKRNENQVGLMRMKRLVDDQYG